MNKAINGFVSALLIITISLVSGCNPVFTDASAYPDGQLGRLQSALTADANKEQGGRVLTILLTMNNPRMAQHSSRVAFQLINNAVIWVSGQRFPTILVVRDDNHHGEASNDPEFIHMTLLQAGFVADMREEPANGLSPKDVAGYDVVWFSNPGYAIDDQLTVQTLIQFAQLGGGLILQGDDVSRQSQLQSLTNLEYVDNGTSYCGVRIDNNRYGNYQVNTATKAHPVLDGIQDIRFAYGDDIDSAKLIGQDATVLAWASVDSSTQNCPAKPVIVALTYSSEPIYQAEEFASSNSCRVATDHNNYSGFGFVDMGGRNSWFEMSINAKTTAVYNLAIRYAIGKDKSRPCDISVNGHIAETVVFRPTRSWSKWWFKTVQVKLYQGGNRIRIWANTHHGGPNIDSIEWSPIETNNEHGSLKLDAKLGLRDFLVSPNGQYRFTLQGDGNLVLRNARTDRVLWAAGTHRKGGRRLILQKDGNLVLYRRSGRALWASNTVGSGASRLTLSDDGTLALYRGGNVVWSRN